MDKDVPDFYDIDQDEMYEHQYADDLDVLEDFEEPGIIDFERMVTKKASNNNKLDGMLMNHICLENNQILKEQENSPEEKVRIKRNFSFDDQMDNIQSQVKETASQGNQSKKRRVDDMISLPIKDDMSSVLAKLNSPSSFDETLFDISRKRVFKRPMLGIDCCTVTSTYGERFFLKLSNLGKEVQKNQWQNKSSEDGLNLLSIAFKRLKAEVDEKRYQQRYTNHSMITECDRNAKDHVSSLKSTELWVEKYTPKNFTDLLSDDGTNRYVLKWLKLWDNIVFKSNKKIRQKTQPVKFTDGQQKMFKRYDYEDELLHDKNGWPKHKVALLCGNPGLGKTTLANVIAQHAGYNVVEMNASDDRSPEVFLNKIEASTQMKSSIGALAKPNCLIIDEIDGAPIQAINILLNLIKYTDTANLRKQKKRKKKEFLLNRPIICICNDQFVPSLRQLRSVAFTLNFPPTAPSRLAFRLQNVSISENLRIDMGALLLLADKTENDIRSCLNTLQFIHQLKKDFKPEDIQYVDVGQKDMKKGVRTILTQVFQMPKNKKKIYGTAPAVANGNSGSSARFNHILHLVSGHSEFEKIVQGLFDQYLQCKLKDVYMESITSGCEWLQFTDIIEQKIQHSQNYVLRRYSSLLPVAFHLLFARAAAPKIQYSNISYENHLKLSHNIQTLQLMKEGMIPYLRRYCLHSISLLDLVPYLFLIILPNLRPVNIKLYSASETQMFKNLIEIMISYNLTYRQERNPEGQYTYMLEPNVEELTTYSGLPQHRHLPYSSKQLITREVDLEKMRRSENILKASTHLNSQINGSDQKSSQTEKNIIDSQKLYPKKIWKNVQERESLDFFGRVVKPVQEKERNHIDVVDNKKSILNRKLCFRFNEGYTNAVRKNVKIRDFL